MGAGTAARAAANQGGAGDHGHPLGHHPPNPQGDDGGGIGEPCGGTAQGEVQAHAAGGGRVRHPQRSYLRHVRHGPGYGRGDLGGQRALEGGLQAFLRGHAEGLPVRGLRRGHGHERLLQHPLHREAAEGSHCL